MRPQSLRSLFSITAAICISFVFADNNFNIVGDGLVSAQMIFLLDENTLMILDKTENNPVDIEGHPAWASQYDLQTNNAQAMDILTNTFCAGGNVLANGSWINVGGNQPITTGGIALNGAPNTVYDDADGGSALRVLQCTDTDTCTWIDSQSNYMNSRRWYPTVETLPTGDAIMIGGDDWGGFVNNDEQNNPTFEYFPSRGDDVQFTFLNDTMPVNLYPLTWLVPSGKLFIQANWASCMLDPVTGDWEWGPNMTYAVRTYPASGATAMLPQTKANNWTAPILFCGGANYTAAEWQDHFDNTNYFRQHPNSKSCVQITPDTDTAFGENDDMLEARSMGQFINLPDGRLFLLNGIANGTAGYNSSSWPYGTNPIYSPAYFDPTQPSGSRWSRNGLQNASLPRLYHSTASLLADGSVVVGGSNPYADFVTNGSIPDAGNMTLTTIAEWWTETRLEIFYPDYYSKPRPNPQNMPSSISYGGAYYTVGLNSSDLSNVNDASDVTFVIIRTGFSTHAMNMGQRMVELESSLVLNGTLATLYVAPLPANPAVIAPGPALAFVVVNGVPSNGTMIMIGNGQLGTQPTSDYPTLPSSNLAPTSSNITIAPAAI